MKLSIKQIAIGLLIVVLGVAAYYLFDTFRSRTTPEKMAAIIHDEDARQLTSRLKGCLKDDSLIVQERAALAIGRIGGKQAAAILFDLLQDGSSDLAGTAAFGLGLTAESEYAVRLLDVAPDLQGPVAARAIVSAARLADSTQKELPEKLTSFLNDPSPEVREAACFGLFLAKARAQAGAIINLLATEPDTMVQRKALFALARLGVGEATPVFFRFLPDADPYVRGLCVRGLALSHDPQAFQYLAIALNDGDLNVQAQAAIGLAGKQTVEAANYLVRKLPSVRDEKVLVEIINGLQQIRDPRALDIVQAHLWGDSSEYVIGSALKYMAAIEKDRAVNLLDSIVNTKPKPAVRVACAEAYGLIGHSTVVPRVVTLFSDEDPVVRERRLTRSLSSTPQILTTISTRRLPIRITSSPSWLPT